MCKQYFYYLISFFAQIWSCYRDLNSGPLPYQGSALPLSYNSNMLKHSPSGHYQHALSYRSDSDIQTTPYKAGAKLDLIF